jgi:hypothetical protein
MSKAKYTDKDIIDAIKSSRSIRQALIKLNIRPVGGNYKIIHNNINRLNIDISHFDGQAWSKGVDLGFKPRRSLEEILVKDSPHKTTYTLKLRLIREGLLKEVCSNCGLSEWCDKKIPLELEHINGINNDNRLENLTLLCPNCHALTSTYRGKNKGKVQKM